MKYKYCKTSSNSNLYCFSFHIIKIITNDETIRFKFDENYKSSQLKNVTVQWITSDGTTDDAAGIKAKALQDFRKFNIDITPKVFSFNNIFK